jgi:Kef-type K+ transport system membrane component KefB
LTIAAARLFSVVARRIGQPAVISEIVGGIALGPTLADRHARISAADVRARVMSSARAITVTPARRHHALRSSTAAQVA